MKIPHQVAHKTAVILITESHSARVGKDSYNYRTLEPCLKKLYL